MSEIIATTQDHLDIFEIKDNFVILKTGKVCAVLQTNAVNFDLLSEMEQDAIIGRFSMLLNSITFPMQIVLRSKRLDITRYIEKIQKIENKITDPLLKYQAESYRKFVQNVIKDNDVLDKRFYVIVPTAANTSAQPGSTPFDWMQKLLGSHSKRTTFDLEKVLRDGRIELTPKVDHIIKELRGLQVKARQLATQELVELYFDVYNPSLVHGQKLRTSVDDYKTAIVNPAIIEE
jgi:type IV secretory pathway VirB4 component